MDSQYRPPLREPDLVAHPGAARGVWKSNPRDRLSPGRVVGLILGLGWLGLGFGILDRPLRVGLRPAAIAFGLVLIVASLVRRAPRKRRQPSPPPAPPWIRRTFG